jgi:AcrR family transcriptional regulator
MDKKKELDQHKLLKRKIVSCAFKLFTKYGVRDVTMDDISSELSMSKRTLYEIFDDKESLLLETLILGRENMKKEVDQIILKSTNVLDVILRVYLFQLSRLKSMIKMFNDITIYPRAQEFFANSRNENNTQAVSFFEKGVAQGIFRDDINFEIYIELLHEQIENLQGKTAFKQFSIYEAYDVVMSVFLRGISTTKGIKIIDDFLAETKKNPDYLNWR